MCTLILNAFATPEEWESNPYALGSDGNPGIAVRQDILDELGMTGLQRSMISLLLWSK